MNAEISQQVSEKIRENSGWVITLSVVLLVMGALSMLAPVVTGIAVALMVGFVMVVGGVTRVVFAFRAQGWGLSILSLLLGALGIVVGLVTLAHPLLGLSFLTLLLAFYLILEGVTETILAFQLRPLAGWGWTLASGVAAIALGAMIWNQWPVSGAWAVGLLVGINILFTGSSLLALGMAARSGAAPQAV